MALGSPGGTLKELGFVHRWVNNDSDRTLLLLHGTGGDENDLLAVGEELDGQANLLSLRGNSREEGLNRFFRRLAEGLLDEDDLRVRTRELYEFLGAAEERKILTRKQTVVVGYSNGANIAASLLMLFPGSLRGAVLLRAMPPFQTQVAVEGDNSPVLLISGARDPIVSERQRLQLVYDLTRAHCPVESVVLGAGHEITAEDVQVGRNWLSKSGWQHREL